VTPAHGTRPTHLSVDDNRSFPHDAEFPLTLVFNRSKHRYSEPWYYGLSGPMALVLIFRPQDRVRFSQSPSGGGKGNPAWDFQWFIPRYEVGKRYRFVMRAMYVPFESPEQLVEATAACVSQQYRLAEISMRAGPNRRSSATFSTARTFPAGST